MAKRKLELFIEIKNEKDFEYMIHRNEDKLICAEIYNSFAGPCSVLDRLMGVIKLDWSNGQMLLLKVMADDISSLSRFWNQSEPVYMFILKNKVTTVFRGVDQIRFGDVARHELNYYTQALEGNEDDRPKYNLDELTPQEQEWHDAREKERIDEITAAATRRARRQAERKRHRAEKIAPHVQQLNFVLYWPHAKRAHPELYHSWDENNIIMVGREEVLLSEEQALDILYEGDAPINEASIHALLAAPALAICFRLLDSDKHFVSLVRRILYEDVPPPEEGKQSKDQPIPQTAFQIYSSRSLSVEQIRQQRRDEKQRAKEEELFKRARRLSEMKRLAVQAKEDLIQQRKIEKEQKKMEALKAGNLNALNNIEDEEEEIDIQIPEKLPEEIVEEVSSEEDEEEYFPPAGLLIPGLYSPPNDIAKANGLPILFPKIVEDYIIPPPEFLPEHVLVMLNISKRHKALPTLSKYKNYVINMGVFKVHSVPDRVEHVTYSVKQYDAMNIDKNQDEIKLCVMLSLKSDVPLLELMDLYPEHISRDASFGEEECAILFPVGYGDDEPDRFEDFDDEQT